MIRYSCYDYTVLWRHNGWDSVSNHQRHHCLLNRLFRRRSKKPSKLRVTGLCAGNSPGTGEFPAQMASNAENVSTWWRHHELNHVSNRDPGVVIFLPAYNLRHGHICGHFVAEQKGMNHKHIIYTYIQVLSVMIYVSTIMVQQTKSLYYQLQFASFFSK